MPEQDDTTDNLDETADTDRVDDTDETANLGDAGKKALDAMKAKWQKERDARKASDAELAKLKEPKPDDSAKPDEATIREQAKAEARAEVARDRALDRIEAKAAKLFADPEDARALLAGRVEEFLDNGQVDNDAITEALDDLLKKKPHLAATAKRFAGGADGGARKGSSTVAQLTGQDIKRMTPQQIVEARAAGRLDDYMAT